MNHNDKIKETFEMFMMSENVFKDIIQIFCSNHFVINFIKTDNNQLT